MDHSRRAETRKCALVGALCHAEKRSIKVGHRGLLPAQYYTMGGRRCVNVATLTSQFRVSRGFSTELQESAIRVQRAPSAGTIGA
jgi:hypothetical protein